MELALKTSKLEKYSPVPTLLEPVHNLFLLRPWEDVYEIYITATEMKSEILLWKSNRFTYV